MIINQKEVQEAYLLLEKKYGYLIEVAQNVWIGLNSSFDPFGQLNVSNNFRISNLQFVDSDMFE